MANKNPNTAPSGGGNSTPNPQNDFSKLGNLSFGQTEKLKPIGAELKRKIIVGSPEETGGSQFNDMVDEPKWDNDPITLDVDVPVSAFSSQGNRAEKETGANAEPNDAKWGGASWKRLSKRESSSNNDILDGQNGTRQEKIIDDLKQELIDENAKNDSDGWGDKGWNHASDNNDASVGTATRQETIINDLKTEIEKKTGQDVKDLFKMFEDGEGNGVQQGESGEQISFADLNVEGLKQKSQTELVTEYKNLQQQIEELQEEREILEQRGETDRVSELTNQLVDLEAHKQETQEQINALVDEEKGTFKIPNGKTEKQPESAQNTENKPEPQEKQPETVQEWENQINNYRKQLESLQTAIEKEQDAEKANKLIEEQMRIATALGQAKQAQKDLVPEATVEELTTQYRSLLEEARKNVNPTDEELFEGAKELKRVADNLENAKAWQALQEKQSGSNKPKGKNLYDPNDPRIALEEQSDGDDERGEAAQKAQENELKPGESLDEVNIVQVKFNRDKVRNLAEALSLEQMEAEGYNLGFFKQMRKSGVKTALRNLFFKNNIQFLKAREIEQQIVNQEWDKLGIEKPQDLIEKAGAAVRAEATKNGKDKIGNTDIRVMEVERRQEVRKQIGGYIEEYRRAVFKNGANGTKAQEAQEKLQNYALENGLAIGNILQVVKQAGLLDRAKSGQKNLDEFLEKRLKFSVAETDLGVNTQYRRTVANKAALWLMDNYGMTPEGAVKRVGWAKTAAMGAITLFGATTSFGRGMLKALAHGNIVGKALIGGTVGAAVNVERAKKTINKNELSEVIGKELNAKEKIGALAKINAKASIEAMNKFHDKDASQAEKNQALEAYTKALANYKLGQARGADLIKFSSGKEALQEKADLLTALYKMQLATQASDTLKNIYNEQYNLAAEQMDATYNQRKKIARKAAMKGFALGAGATVVADMTRMMIAHRDLPMGERWAKIGEKYAKDWQDAKGVVTKPFDGWFGKSMAMAKASQDLEHNPERVKQYQAEYEKESYTGEVKTSDVREFLQEKNNGMTNISVTRRFGDAHDAGIQTAMDENGSIKVRVLGDMAKDPNTRLAFNITKGSGNQVFLYDVDDDGYVTIDPNSVAGANLFRMDESGQLVYQGHYAEVLSDKGDVYQSLGKTYGRNAIKEITRPQFIENNVQNVAGDLGNEVVGNRAESISTVNVYDSAGATSQIEIPVHKGGYQAAKNAINAVGKSRWDYMGPPLQGDSWGPEDTPGALMTQFVKNINSSPEALSFWAGMFRVHGAEGIDTWEEVNDFADKLRAMPPEEYDAFVNNFNQTLAKTLQGKIIRVESVEKYNTIASMFGLDKESGIGKVLGMSRGGWNNEGQIIRILNKDGTDLFSGPVMGENAAQLLGEDKFNGVVVGINAGCGGQARWMTVGKVEDHLPQPKKDPEPQPKPGGGEDKKPKPIPEDDKKPIPPTKEEEKPIIEEDKKPTPEEDDKPIPPTETPENPETPGKPDNKLLEKDPEAIKRNMQTQTGEKIDQRGITEKTEKPTYDKEKYDSRSQSFTSEYSNNAKTNTGGITERTMTQEQIGKGNQIIDAADQTFAKQKDLSAEEAAKALADEQGRAADKAAEEAAKQMESTVDKLANTSNEDLANNLSDKYADVFNEIRNQVNSINGTVNTTTGPTLTPQP